MRVYLRGRVKTCHSRFIFLLIATALIGSNPAFALTCPATIAKGKSLMIRALSVVEDPERTAWTGSTDTTSDGAWSFGRLMSSMAGTNDPSDFVQRWLEHWEADRRVNDLNVPARPSIKSLVTDPWPKLVNGKIDLTKAPMRLLAIVYRPDLRNLAIGTAGEGRFVFGVLDGAGSPLQFTVILEYTLPALTSRDVRKWASVFQKLSSLKFGPAFNANLEKITNRFTAKNAVPTRINGSAISQIRTNEIALDFPWELREFRLDPQTMFLQEVTVAQTPAIDFNGTGTLADWLDANTSAILRKKGTNSIEVPLVFDGQPFRAGAITNNIDIWNATASNRKAMFKVAFNTCNGCHGAETNTSFLHVTPREAGSVASLSAFLTGTTVDDPRDGRPVRRFNELERRKANIAIILCPPENQRGSE